MDIEIEAHIIMTKTISVGKLRQQYEKLFKIGENDHLDSKTHNIEYNSFCLPQDDDEWELLFKAIVLYLDKISDFICVKICGEKLNDSGRSFPYNDKALDKYPQVNSDILNAIDDIRKIKNMGTIRKLGNNLHRCSENKFEKEKRFVPLKPLNSGNGMTINLCVIDQQITHIETGVILPDPH